MKKVVFTGGPCSGKSTLLNYFKARFPTIEETARPILDQYKHACKDEIAHLIYNAQKNEEDTFKSVSNYVFLDRSRIDTVAYPILHGIELKTNYQEDLQNNKYDLVFLLSVAPKELYVTDNTRKETHEEALRIQYHLQNTYRFFGYEPIVLPFNSVEERIEKVESYLNMEEKLYG